jgi:hypothetical protein
MPRALAQKAAHGFKSADGSQIFCMVKAKHLRLAAKLSLARAVRTGEPEVVERLVLRAGEYLDQATALEVAQRAVLEKQQHAA